jgi:type VI secretion system protein ImpK
MSDIGDPFKPPDGVTIVRPRPGAGRRQPGGAGGNVHTPASYMPADAVLPPLRDALASGLNPLVAAATPLLVLSGQLRGMAASPDVAALRRYALDEIRRFEASARSAGVPNEVVVSARYALCSAIDEAVLSTPWGSQGDWAQQTLLVALHRETWGGDKFFKVLNALMASPEQHIDLLELLYLCMAFGFAGKYSDQVRGDGRARLAEIEQEVYQLIRSQRTRPQEALSLRWQGIKDRRNRLIRYVPLWVIAAAALAIVAVAFTFFYSWLTGAAAPVHGRLARIGTEDFTGPVVPTPVAGPTIKQLLAPQEKSGLLSVEEQGARSVITPLAGDLFASGRADVNRKYDELFEQIGRALSQVPGRVLVRGHTDDQPIQSIRFRDNFDLSRQRAAAVVQVLASNVPVTRMDPVGVGSEEPKFTPVSTAENRARNRRVEIVHVRGT